MQAHRSRRRSVILILAYEQSGDFTSAKSEMEDYTKNYPNDEEAAREYLFLMTR